MHLIAKRTKKLSNRRRKGLSLFQKSKRFGFLRSPTLSGKRLVSLSLKNEVTFCDNVSRFFERYKQMDPKLACDHYFDDPEAVAGGWKTTLHTPWLYNWTFTGIGRTPWEAETLAYSTFVCDPRVLEIARMLVPPSTKIATLVKNKLNGEARVDLSDRGFDLKRLAEEAKQEIVAKFKSLGCRNAIGDNNA